MTDFGANVRALRKRRGWTLNDFAVRVSHLAGRQIHQQTISDIERRNATVKEDMLALLARALSVSTEDLRTGKVSKEAAVNLTPREEQELNLLLDLFRDLWMRSTTVERGVVAASFRAWLQTRTMALEKRLARKDRK